MEALVIKQNNIVENAIKFVKHNADIPTAIGKGTLLETLKKRMMRGEVVRFCYRKLNGEIRTAVGTLQSNAVEANVVGTGVPKRFYGMFVYLDLEKMAWRGFKVQNFIGIID